MNCWWLVESPQLGIVRKWAMSNEHCGCFMGNLGTHFLHNSNMKLFHCWIRLFVRVEGVKQYQDSENLDFVLGTGGQFRTQCFRMTKSPQGTRVLQNV